MSPVFYRCGLGFITCFYMRDGKMCWFNCSSWANSKLIAAAKKIGNSAELSSGDSCR